MKRRIRKASDLPEWFDRSKYDGAASLDAAGWYEQLYVRYSVSRMRCSRCDSKGFLSALSAIRKYPIVNVLESVETQCYFFGGALYELKSNDNKLTHSLGVRLATVRDLYHTEGNIDRPERDYARKFFAQLFDDDRDWWLQPLKYRAQDWMDQPVDAHSSSNHFLITVMANLRLPDRVLIERFEQLLKGLRESMARGDGQPLSSPRKPDFSSWINFGVLPYLDLFDWAAENEVSIPNRVIADAIFPVGEGGEEVVRKTTAPLAKELLTERSLDLLASLAAQAIAERNNA